MKNACRRILSLAMLSVLLVGITPNVQAQELKTEKVEAKTGKVLFLLAKGFNRSEYYEIYYPLLALGYEVDVAGPEKGTIFFRKEGTPDDKGRDTVANLSLDDVNDISVYDALVIPGGYSPGFLEAYPKAIEIARQFMEANKLVAAACHGPRLLLQADTLRGRTYAAYFELSDEIPDKWNGPNRGNYVDRGGIVVDDQLVTARYAGEMQPFLYEILELLVKDGFPGKPDKATQLVMVAPDGLQGHTRWTYFGVVSRLGVRVGFQQKLAGLEKLLAREDFNPSGLVILEGADPKMIAYAKEKLGEDFPTLNLKKGNAEKDLPVLLEFGLSHAEAVEKTVKEPITAVIAVREGFDINAVVAAETMMRYYEMNPVIVGPSQGWHYDTNGAPLEVDYSYEELEKLGENALIIMPGSMGPQDNPDARQAIRTDWIQEQGKRDKLRFEWLITQRENGATLMAVGLDSLFLARDEMFKGKRFASSTQALWSFPRRTAGAYSKDLVRETDTRLITVKSERHLPLAFKTFIKPETANSQDAAE